MNERVNECIEAHARRLERSSMAMMSFGHPTPRVVVVAVVAAVVVESFISPRGAGRPSRACFVFSFSTRRHQCVIRAISVCMCTITLVASRASF